MNKITQRTLSIKFALLSSLMPFFLSPTPASALFGRTNCRNVSLTAINKTGGPIKIFDIEYFNPRTNLWKNEWVSNRIIANNGTWTDERNLEKVYDLKTKVRFQYRTLKENGKWSRKVETDSNTQRCSDGETYSVTLNPR
ncbi:MAG: hypothetical protein AAGB19_08095 [Cyanobacteria bacterium P01_F01_bin.3]